MSSQCVGVNVNWGGTKPTSRGDEQNTRTGGRGGANKSEEQSGGAQETHKQLGMNKTHKQNVVTDTWPDTQRFIYRGGADLKTKSGNFSRGGEHKIWRGGTMFEEVYFFLRSSSLLMSSSFF